MALLQGLQKQEDCRNKMPGDEPGIFSLAFYCSGIGGRTTGPSSSASVMAAGGGGGAV